ncbi:MAG: helix-turn-helix domain-containing protein [Polyangiaceae bacterium]
MAPLTDTLYLEIASALTDAGRPDLVARLRARNETRALLSSGQAAALLGVASTNTVKNWLESGFFPNAFQTAGGHWRFPRGDVEAAKQRIDELRERNRTGDLTPPDEDYGDPPLL